ncbi:hypothetical protein [Butyrivibrio sp. VCD2006]|uniref:hypothetical protein n=1 Tax=Butyrivibrio sp. VCD2006 TaxID=1280664 RepID=UPI0004148A8A|nr:hypothetical protein [Butyrivibrio sp. VCD2006]
MPAYFSIDISINKSDRYDGMFTDFIDIIQKEDLRFISGGWEFFDETLEQIIAWNEKKLKKNFELGYREHYSSDYRQIFLDYNNFSEVRAYIHCYDDEFVFTILIPEDELLQWGNGKGNYDPRKISNIKKLIVTLWDWECVSAIQTTLELSGDITKLDDLKLGNMPSIVPFAIIPEEWNNYNFDERFNITKLNRNGILIECY